MPGVVSCVSCLMQLKKARIELISDFSGLCSLAFRAVLVCSSSMYVS